ncbi:MAG: hypothetical protein COA78_16780 [Blastopirellula sp.]|nr:MAG: hypothetical protein COA78_16780 [Blastopirellula sp.]
MNESDIDTIEKLVGLPLPEEYINLLLEYPEALSSMKCDGMCAATGELFNKANRILRENKFVRSSKFNTEDAYGDLHPWKNHFLVIGDSGGGDYYAINLKNKKVVVYFWDHGTSKLEKHASSLEQHIKKIFDLYFELAVDGLF